MPGVGCRRLDPHANATEATMSSPGHLPDDPIFAAIEALHCPPEELAVALGIDVRTLWGYQLGGRSVPTFVIRRLIAVLEDRALFLRDVAASLDTRRAPRSLAAVS